MMKVVCSILCSIVGSILLVETTLACSQQPGWTEITMEDRLHQADLVLYGREIQRYLNKDNIQNTIFKVTDAEFEVYCILKGDDEDINTDIILEGVSSKRRPCSNTHLSQDTDVILTARRTPSGNYEWQEINHQSAADLATSDHVTRAQKVCGLDSPRLPLGRKKDAKPACPSSILRRSRIRRVQTCVTK